MSRLRCATDLELHQAAVDLARQRAYWLQAAEVGSPVLTRRQCLLRARKREAHIVDIAIQVEMRCELERPRSAS